MQKLTPNHDLQCYFFQPSAIAALSGTSASGFRLSGTWRQQFDWAVVEWNRDNVFEHPALRNLPDGDLSGITLSYLESRTNCIPLDSNLFHTVSWPFLRVWAPDGSGVEQVYQVPIASYATPAAGSYASAYADFTLSGTLTAGDYVGIAYLESSVTYAVTGLEGSVGGVLDQIVAEFATAPLLRATRTGDTLRVTYPAGANGNRFGVYSFACSATGGASTLSWDSASQTLSGGTSPTQWQVTIPFNSLSGYIDPDYTTLYPIVNPNQIRKLRWTYAADLQAGSYSRSEFEVVVSGWTVSGTGLDYSVAGPGSLRFEDLSDEMTYAGAWSATAGLSMGNYSGGTIHLSTTPGDSVTCSYKSGFAHTLYLGTRYLGGGSTVTISVDGGAAQTLNLELAGEDVLVRYPVGSYAAGAHSVTVTNAGSSGELFYCRLRRSGGTYDDAADLSERTEVHAGDGLGHTAFAGAGSGAHGVDDRHTGIYREVESLCGRVVVLRTGEFGKCLLDGDGDVHRRAGYESGGDGYSDGDGGGSRADEIDQHGRYGGYADGGVCE